MAKLSRQVENQMASAAKVSASARTHAPTVSSALAKVVKDAQGANAPAASVFETLMLSGADALDFASKALYSAELKLAHERSDDVQPRQARDEQQAELVQILAQVKGFVELALDEKGLKTYGLNEDIPRNTARATLNFASKVAHLMDEYPQVKTTAIGITMDTAVLAQMLKAKAAVLAPLVETMDTEARELDEALAERNRSSAQWSDTYQGVATMLMGLYRMAGYKDLADKVKPTIRAAQGNEVAQDVTEETGEPKAGETPA